MDRPKTMKTLLSVLRIILGIVCLLFGLLLLLQVSLPLKSSLLIESKWILWMMGFSLVVASVGLFLNRLWGYIFILLALIILRFGIHILIFLADVFLFVLFDSMKYFLIAYNQKPFFFMFKDM